MPQDEPDRRPQLEIGLLGSLVVTRDGLRRALPASRKTRALLAYLALAQRACRREDLCDLLWDGASDPRRELRWSLAKIRAALGPWLQVSPDGVAVACESRSIDALAFRELASDAACEGSIARALAVWRGAPLADVEVRGQHAFHAWLAAERDSLIRLRTRLLQAAVDCAWSDPAAVLSAARRLVAQEPWSEWGHARVVQSLERCGRPGEAADYRAAMRRILSCELGVSEMQVLARLPPPPSSRIGSACSVGPSGPRPGVLRVVRIEPLAAEPAHDGLGALATQLADRLALGLWRGRSCALLDAGRPEASPPQVWPDADFVVRGALTGLGGDVQFSLRCVDLRRGTVVWHGRAELRHPFVRALSRWVEDAADALTDALAGLTSAGEDGERHGRLFLARQLAGVLRPAANREALGLLNAVLAEDGDEPVALSLAAWCHAQRAVYNWSANPDLDRGEARQCAALATRVGFDDPECLTAIASARTLVADRHGAGALLDRALRLNPRAAGAHVRSGWLANYLDQPERAARHFRQAMRFRPLDKAAFNCLTGLGVAHFIRREHGQAIRCMEQALALNPGAAWIYRNLVPAYAAAGDHAKAETGLCALLREQPGLTVGAVCEAMVFSPGVMAKIADGLRSTGLPRG